MVEESLLKPGLAAGVLALLWFLEGVLPMFEGAGSRLRHDLGNLALGLVNALVASLLFAGLTLGATEWARASRFGLLHQLPLPDPWLLLLALLVLDLWQYLWHRVNHHVPLLWRFHAVHHSDAAMSASTGVRFHTGEIVLSSAARLLILPLLGITIAQVLIYETVLLPIILFHHSNVRVPERLDRWLRAVIVTPRLHWVHHSEHQPETDSNFASILSLWDRLFGSFRLRRDPENLRLGLGLHEREWRSVGGVLLHPFRRASRRDAGADRS
jgi:sterol desaturase/sphingolipid hydroxylase (fatty acid hydroxylase superfamily)